MGSKTVSFKGAFGDQLSAKLELPDNQKPHNVAIFAHCFTCSKNLSAVRTIAHELTLKGFAVLRFDFTGLGNSKGDFSDTTFSSNVEDLKLAAAFIENELMTPSLLIGHSLGGAAVVFAAAEIDSIQAVATIGAPSSPDHVEHLFEDRVNEIKERGKAKVNIGGRSFFLSKSFVDDIQQRDMKTTLLQLNKPLAVFHSPQDDIVGIKNAEEIYHAARHPKSYISLDGANHLLTNPKDSAYVGSVIAGWAERYLNIPEREIPKTKHQVAVSLGNEGFTSTIVSGNHVLTADEPEEVGGNDFGPSPYEFLSSGLGACTAMTLRMYADFKKIPLEKVVVHLDHKRDYPKLEGDVDPKQKIDIIEREIELHGDLSNQQMQKLLEIADKCPVHQTLTSQTTINTSLKEN